MLTSPRYLHHNQSIIIMEQVAAKKNIWLLRLKPRPVNKTPQYPLLKPRNNTGSVTRWAA